MSLFGGVLTITGVSYLMLTLFAILALGYALGRITIKGISLGSAGVFIIALVYGAFFYTHLDAAMAEGAKTALKIVENIGLILFVSSVGFIAGPKFFSNMKRNFKSYVLIGLVIILSGGIAAALCILFGRTVGGETDYEGFTAIVSGLLSGALTSTPAFSAAKATVGEAYEDLVSVGYGIAYLFGVIGVVLFVQLVPKLEKADMKVEREKMLAAGSSDEKKTKSRIGTLKMDPFGIMMFSLAAAIGLIIGLVKIPLSSAGLSGTTFSLTTTGGCLLTALVFGHFGKCGKVSLMPEISTLKVFRELGLIFFLIGAGVSGGANFVNHFKPIYFVYGVVITLLPMILGYFFAKHVLKLCLLNSIGSITGGMTSTPALGTLINFAGTEDVAAAYAATYPVALVAVVLLTQLFIGIF